jgi:hypothetical protein
MSSSTPAVALVESPAQLLNVLEWVYQNRSSDLPAERMGDRMSIMVLPPPEPAARMQLDRMTELAETYGCTVSWREVRGMHGARLRALRAVSHAVSAAQTVVIGDPFSGFMQLVIDIARVRELVVVDDGSASIRFVEIMESGDELIRWHRQDRSSMFSRMISARARRRMAVGADSTRPRRPVQLFTSMPVHSRTIRIGDNRLAWTRQLYQPPQLLAGADLVGSSLVETGVVSQDRYLSAVAALVTGQRVNRYLAHRRESNEKLQLISELGIDVVRPGLPLELFARQGPIAERVISFPSTVVHTLPLALLDTPVEVVVCDIDQDWFAPGSSSIRSGTFLTSVTSTARRTYGLRTVVTA